MYFIMMKMDKEAGGTTLQWTVHWPWGCPGLGAALSRELQLLGLRWWSSG